MKSHLISRLITILAVMIAVFAYLRLCPSGDQSEIVDVLVAAGLEFAVSPVDAELLTHRKIVITTDINASSAQRTIRALLLLDSISSTAPIDLYIRTEGGWVSDAFGIIDVIENITAPVNTHAIGGTHSSGAMILASGTGTRYGYPYSSIMFHAGLYADDDKYSEDRLDNARLIQFWKQNSSVPQEWITGEKDETFFLDPDEALKYGLIDQIKTNANNQMQNIGTNAPNSDL